MCDLHKPNLENSRDIVAEYVGHENVCVVTVSRAETV